MAENTSRVKVVHLITLLELGGAQGNTIYSVKNLSQKGFDVTLWSGPGAFWDEDIKNDSGIPSFRFIPFLVREIHPLKDFLAFISIVRLIRKQKPQILHTHSSKAGILGRLAGYLTGVPIIIHTFHGFGFTPNQNLILRHFYLVLEKLCASLSDALIFVSRSNLDEAKTKKIGNPNKYHLIRSGIPIKNILEESKNINYLKLKKDLGWEENSAVILTIGAFKPQKNLSDFISAAKLIHEKLPQTRFLIIGDGALRSSIEDQIKRENLTDIVRLLGWTKNVVPYLRMAHVFCLTSLWEGLPRALVEAMVVGIPSVCYGSDGVNDLLSKGGGFVIEPGNINKFVQSVCDLLTNPPLHNNLSLQAPNLVSNDFDIDIMVQQQADLYLNLLK